MIHVNLSTVFLNSLLDTVLQDTFLAEATVGEGEGGSERCQTIILLHGNLFEIWLSK